MSEWQPIETAPKGNENWILVSAPGNPVMIAEYAWDAWWNYREEKIHPTHWMPLPDPPK